MKTKTIKYKMTKEKEIKEKIRDILNEEMVNYRGAKDIGEKDEVFDRANDKIWSQFEKEKQKWMEKIEKLPTGLFDSISYKEELLKKLNPK